MFSQLGDIKFEGLQSPRTWQETHGATYGQIPHVGGKPSSQLTAAELTKIELDIKLSREFCNPSDSLSKLKTAQNTGEILPFITGSGALVGKFVITTLDIQVEETTPTGDLISLKASITLEEYASPDTTQEPQGTAYKTARPQKPMPASPQTKKPKRPKTPAQKIADHFLKIRSAVATMQNILNAVKRGMTAHRRAVRQLNRELGNINNLYTDAKLIINKTKKIKKRATRLVDALNSGNLQAATATISNDSNISEMETIINNLSEIQKQIDKLATLVASFAATKETGD